MGRLRASAREQNAQPRQIRRVAMAQKKPKRQAAPAEGGRPSKASKRPASGKQPVSDADAAAIQKLLARYIFAVITSA